ncbi:helix-turn-helix transcriptional regulator [Chitinophaga sp. Mgbs1]|uniref:Helix-turn-helix transcriptional regulator n=1 Tax=Chitinophaga solisilvae TaxID=1233460 RepID=A0A3S1B164_9BACT|nr:helix-turn-helix transcriptional regulator [Chitinophaga solisilvae]
MDCNRLKAELAERKRSNKELAAFLKTNENTVSRWCTNKSQPSLATLFRIAEFLGVSPGILLSEPIGERRI